MKIAYVRQVGNQVGLYDSSNREYTRVNGRLVSYSENFVMTDGGKFSTHNHIYDSSGKLVRDVQK